MVQPKSDQPDRLLRAWLHRTVCIMLAYLNCHTYILFMVVFTLVGGPSPGSDLLVYLAGNWLLLAITITTAYLITSDGHVPR